MITREATSHLQTAELKLNGYPVICLNLPVRQSAVRKPGQRTGLLLVLVAKWKQNELVILPAAIRQMHE